MRRDFFWLPQLVNLWENIVIINKKDGQSLFVSFSLSLIIKQKIIKI